jgi:hypothetical protein
MLSKPGSSLKAGNKEHERRLKAGRLINSNKNN